MGWLEGEETSAWPSVGRGKAFVAGIAPHASVCPVWSSGGVAQGGVVRMDLGLSDGPILQYWGPLSSSAAKYPSMQAGTRASFALQASGCPGSERRLQICSQERWRRCERSVHQACVQEAPLMRRCRVRTGSTGFYRFMLNSPAAWSKTDS